MHRGALRLGSLPVVGLAKAATVPACLVCASPAVAAPLLAGMLLPVTVAVHEALFVLAPVNLALLLVSARRHRNPVGLLLAVVGVVLILSHMLSHYVAIESLPVGFRVLVPEQAGALARLWNDTPLGRVTPDGVLPGALLLLLGVLLDWRVRQSQAAACAPSDYWHEVLTGAHPGLTRGRRLMRRLPVGPRCKLCSAPFAGVGGAVMRLVGKGPSSMNPRFCGDCLTKMPLGGAEVELSLLFADVRGSTPLAERSSIPDFAALMARFYVIGTDVLIRSDALVDHFRGDAVVGLYVPGFAGADHARRAVDAAGALLRATGHLDATGPWLPVGVGVHTGRGYVGAVGADGAVADIAILGDVANTAARLSAMARAGEILVSTAAAAAARLDTDRFEHRRLELKGREAPADVSVLRAEALRA
jgi:adenylate cyclase